MNLIFRITDNCSDAEILMFDEIKKEEYFKAISIKELVKELKQYEEADLSYKKDLFCVDKDVIAVNDTCIVTKQEEHRRIVTYKGKAYEINFPNSIYIICHNGSKIDVIEAYCYIEYNGLNTELYKYAMPNMLGANRICMGSAPRDIDPQNYKSALENVIYTQYTHDWVDDIKSFRNTAAYFEYLEKNSFPYNLLSPLNCNLSKVLM